MTDIYEYDILTNAFLSIFYSQTSDKWLSGGLCVMFEFRIKFSIRTLE